jgi:hypothetical protein
VIDGPRIPLGRARARVQIRWGGSAELRLTPTIPEATTDELVSGVELPSLAPRIWRLAAVAETAEEPAPLWTPSESWIEVWTGAGGATARWQIPILWAALPARPTPPPLAAAVEIPAQIVRARVTARDLAAPGTWRGRVTLWAAPLYPILDSETLL